MGEEQNLGEEDISITKNLVRIQNTGIIKVGKTLVITNKLLEEHIKRGNEIDAKAKFKVSQIHVTHKATYVYVFSNASVVNTYSVSNSLDNFLKHFSNKDGVITKKIENNSFKPDVKWALAVSDVSMKLKIGDPLPNNIKILDEYSEFVNEKGEMYKIYYTEVV